MIVTHLKIANLRAIEAASFNFQPGFNLLVGVNGVGKTSVLDALKVSLSAVMKQVNKLPSRVESFATADIRMGTAALTMECVIRMGERHYTYVVHKPRETSVPQKETGLTREQVHVTPEKAEFLGEVPRHTPGYGLNGRPLAVMFSTNRAVPSERSASKKATAGGLAAALADAFANRELRLGEFAAWIHVQQELQKERPASAHALKALDNTVRRFLPGYQNLRLAGEKDRQLWIDRGRVAVPVRQLSDGERGTLALVLDLSRRLAQANPKLNDPAGEAAAVVLIDEIDLHLHPKWQRQIVHNLQTAFPNCQFIATTHSPQVIGEVAHERIQIIANSEVYSPTHSYGVDSSRVLEEVMHSDPRAKEVKDLLSEISEVIGREHFDRGHQLLSQLAKKLGENDPEVTRIRTLLDFVEGKE